MANETLSSFGTHDLPLILLDIASHWGTDTLVATRELTSHAQLRLSDPNAQDDQITHNEKDDDRSN